MRGISRLLSAIAISLGLMTGSALAQSTCQYIQPGAVLTAGQWNNCFAAKADANGTPATYLPLAGGTMTGELVTALSTVANAGFNLPPGTAPTSPNNGDMWVTASGLYVQVNGATVGPLGTGGGGGITALTGDVTASGSGSVAATIAANAVTYAKMQQTGAGSVLLGNPTGSAAAIQEITLGAGLAFSGGTLVVTGTPATAIVVGSGGTTITGARTNNFCLYDNAGVVYEQSCGVASSINIGATIGSSTVGEVLVVGASNVLAEVAQLGPSAGGTGVNNGSSTITVGGNFAFSGGFTFTATITGNTAVTFPTSGTIATTGNLVTSLGNAAADTTLSFAGTGAGPYTGTVTGALNLANANVWTGVISESQGLAANTSGDGFVLENLVAATSTNQRFSPRLRLTGQGWKTTSVAASQEVDWILENEPVQGTTSPTSNLAIGFQVNGGGYTYLASLSSAGRLTTTSAVLSGVGGLEVLGAVNLPSGNGQASFGASSTLGAEIIGEGSTNDITLQNKSGTTVCDIATGTTILSCVGMTITSGLTNGDLLSNTSGAIADSGVAVPAAPSTYSYPYGFGNAGCFTNTTCTIPTGQVAANGVYKGTASNGLAYLWDNNRWVNNNTIPVQILSTNPLGVELGNATIPAQTISGKTFSLHFVSSNITGSPITVSYTGTGGDTVATVATKLCNAVIANTNLSSATTGLPMVCDANQGGGGFNLQWSILINTVTVTSTGTGTITLPSTVNNLDGIFFHYDRAISGYTLVAGDAVQCTSHEFNSAITDEFCTLVVSNVGGSALIADLVLIVSNGAVGPIRVAEFSDGMILNCNQGDPMPTFAGAGTLTICNSDFGGGLYFSPVTGGNDAHIFENAGNSLVFSTSSALLFQTNSGTDLMDYGATNAGWTITQPLWLTGLATSGGVKYLCLGNTGEVTAQSGSC